MKETWTMWLTQDAHTVISERAKQCPDEIEGFPKWTPVVEVASLNDDDLSIAGVAIIKRAKQVRKKHYHLSDYVKRGKIDWREEIIKNKVKELIK